MTKKVGAGIVEIITESLYDKPIVIFREYVQNSADSLSEAQNGTHAEGLQIEIWENNGSLFFLDNGVGISQNSFEEKMGNIAFSGKIKAKNIGYKGIGRLSGISYCNRLHFINILDYENSLYQLYTVDCNKYSEKRKQVDFNELEFRELMDTIAFYKPDPNSDKINNVLSPKKELFNSRNNGFLVIMEGISTVLSITMKDPSFIDNLCWLLPVPFKKDLLSEDQNDYDQKHLLFSSLCNEPAFKGTQCIPAKSYTISYNGKKLYRPITRKFLRDYLCRCDFEQYAVCISSFSNNGIMVDNSNPFRGIRVYIDNILLCDETELIPALQQFGVLSHTSNETIQAVRGIGAAIYIVDKISLSANARRTFIDVTDDDSFRFIKLLGEFVESVFVARYALSRYLSAKKNNETVRGDIEELGQKAQDALCNLARRHIDLPDVSVEQNVFTTMSLENQKRLAKSKINKAISEKVRRYLELSSDIRLETCVDDFITWLTANPDF